MKRGFGLVEIVIASAIISATIFSLVYVFVIATRLEAQASNKIRANFLAEEGLEVLRLLRDASWSSYLAPLNTSTTYYLSFNAAASAWSIVTTNPGQIDGLFSRKITLENVSRAPLTDDIEATYNAANDDPDTKKINVEVSWNERGLASEIIVSTYLADIFDN